MLRYLSSRSLDPCLPLFYLVRVHMISLRRALRILTICSPFPFPIKWISAEYVCPKCGHFNPSARAVRQARSTGRSSASPSRPSMNGGGEGPGNGSAPRPVDMASPAVREERSRSRGSGRDEGGEEDQHQECGGDEKDDVEVSTRMEVDS